MNRHACLAAIVLWAVTVFVGGWFFVEGYTTEGSDGRTEILLVLEERDLILAKMRQFLKAVD